MTALYALRFSLNKDVRNVRIASNADGYGAFDDIIIRLDFTTGKSELHVIQLKHKIGNKMRILKSEFDKAKGEFTLQKYKDSYFGDIKKRLEERNDDLMEGLSLDDVKMYLLTNANIGNRNQIIAINSNLLNCKILHDSSHDFINTQSHGHYQFKVNEPFPELLQYFCECLKESFSSMIIKCVQEEFQEFTSVLLLKEVIDSFQEKLKVEFENGKSSLEDALKTAAIHTNSMYKIDGRVFNFVKNYFLKDLETAQNTFFTKSLPRDEYKKFINKQCEINYDHEEESRIRSIDKDFFEKITSNELKEIIGSFLRDESVMGHELLQRYYQHKFKLAKQNEYVEFSQRFRFYDRQVDYKEAQEKIAEILKISFGEECTDVTEDFIKFIKDFFDEENRLLTKRDVKCKLLKLLTGEEELDNRYEIFESITNINDTEQRDEILKEIKVSLQGRRPVTLQELTTKEFQKNLSAKFLLKNIRQIVCVGTDESENPKDYITRKFYKIIIQKEVLWETKNNIFIIDVAFPADLSSKIFVVDDLKSNDFTSLRFTDKNLLIVLGKNDLFETVNKIKEPNEFSIHYMKVCNSHCLEWQKSWGDVEKLKNFIIETELVDEGNVLNYFSNTLNVVGANPGMGKSTLLNRLGVLCEPKRLVLKLDLNAHSKALQDEDSELRQNPLKYVSNLMKSAQANAFEDDLFRHLRKNGQVIFFVDSFDEISPKYSKAAMSIIGVAQKSEILTWVFTRPFAEAFIERRFRALPIRMKGLSREDIEVYLRKKWGLNADEKISLTDGMVSFYEVPHYLHMLATICVNPTDLPELKITDLYKKFIDNAFDIHLDRRKLDKEANQTELMISEYRETYLKVHTTAALCVIYGRRYLIEKRMIKERAFEKMNRHFSGDKLNFELIVAVREEAPIFSHRTYAEYLAAVWLYKKLLENEMLKEAHQVLLKQENESVRLMFDRLSSENNPLHLATLEGDLEKIETLCDNSNAIKEIGYKDTFGRTPLHFAMSYLSYSDIADKRNSTQVKIADLLASFFKENIVILKHQDILSNSDFYAYSEKTGNLYLLHIAAYWGAMNVLTLLSLFCRENLRLERQDDLYGWMALHAASFTGLEECVHLLVEMGADVNLKTLYGLETAAHVAAGKGHVHILRFLLQHGSNVKAFDGLGRTILHFASCEDQKNCVRYLIETGESANFKTETGKQTAMHLAAKNGHVTTLKCLLENGGYIDEKDSHDWTPLHFASRFGHVNCVNCLIEMGANINLTTKSNETPFFLAVREGHLDVVKLFVEKGCDINYLDSRAITPLLLALTHGRITCASYLLLEKSADISCRTEDLMHMAAEKGYINILKHLINVTGDINKVNSNELTVLHTASLFGSTDCVRFLLEAGADQKLKTKTNKIAMHFAAREGHVEILHLLGGNVNEVDSDKLTPLHCASRYGRMKCARFLVKKGADVNLKTKAGRTPMHLAAEGGHLHIIRFLVEENGADVDQADFQDWTTLHLASDLGNLDCVRYLIDMGANINSETIVKETAVYLAAERGHAEILKFLMDNCNQNQSQLWTILERACHNNHVECVLYLLDNYFEGICSKKNLMHVSIQKGLVQIVKFSINNLDNINEVDSQGRTPLHCASFYGQIECMKYLLATGISVNLKTQPGQKTPMHFAAQEGHVEVLKMLTKRGVNDIDVVDSLGQSALHFASLGGSVGCVRYLIDQGANVNLKNRTGKTPLHLAAEKGYTMVVNLLIEHKGNVNEIDYFGRTPLNYM